MTHTELSKIDNLITILQGMKEGRRWEWRLITNRSGWFTPDQSLEHLSKCLLDGDELRVAPPHKLRNKRPDELPYVLKIRSMAPLDKGYATLRDDIDDDVVAYFISNNAKYTTDGKTFHDFTTTEEEVG